MATVSTPTLPQRTTTTAARRRGKGDRDRRERLAGYAFVAPSAIGVGVFVLLPMLLAFALGFFEATGFGQIRFIGLTNYRRLFGDALFLHSLRVTAVYVLLFVPGLYFLGLGMALLVNGDLPARAFFRASFFAPYTISLVVVALVWRYILADRVGILSTLLTRLGAGPLSFLGQPNLALLTVAFVSVWFLVGFYMLILLGGLQDIPRDLYEAAQIDGAGAWRQLRHITLPMLRPTTFFVLVLATIAGLAGLQAFDLIFVMTGGGPANATSLGIFYIYQQAFEFNQFGYASAIATWYALALMLMMGIAFWFTKGGRFEFD
jgi:multiple sugar transport system permease protein